MNNPNNEFTQEEIKFLRMAEEHCRAGSGLAYAITRQSNNLEVNQVATAFMQSMDYIMREIDRLTKW